jgi:hypothetical protein
MHPTIEVRDGQPDQAVNQHGDAARVRHQQNRILLFMLLCALPAMLAAAGADLAIPLYAVAGGGGSSQSAAFTLMGSVGQPVGGYSSSVDFTLNHGFWPATIGESGGDPGIPGNQIYLPQVAR